MIATSGKDGEQHLTALSQLSKFLMNSKTQEQIKSAKNFKDFVSAFNEEKETISNQSDNGKYDIVAITACPTGIAHTYMAQEKLEEYAKALGKTIKVETQGRRGLENKLTDSDIKNASMIILAHDKALVGLDRFNNMEVIDTNTNDAIFNGLKLISEYQQQPKKTIKAKAENSDSSGDDFSFKKFKDIKGNLLAGVSKMLPFVVAGGIILGIGFLFDLGTTGNGTFGTHREIAR